MGAIDEVIMTFPTTIYEQRPLENLPGLTYDGANKKTLFAEDILNLGAEVRAIQQALGTNLENIQSMITSAISAALLAENRIVGNLTFPHVAGLNLPAGYVVTQIGSAQTVDLTVGTYIMICSVEYLTMTTGTTGELTHRWRLLRGASERIQAQSIATTTVPRTSRSAIGIGTVTQSGAHTIARYASSELAVTIRADKSHVILIKMGDS